MGNVGVSGLCWDPNRECCERLEEIAENGPMSRRCDLWLFACDHAPANQSEQPGSELWVSEMVLL